MSQALIDAEPEHDLNILTERIDAATEQLATELSTERAEEPVLGHAGMTIPPSPTQQGSSANC